MPSLQQRQESLASSAEQLQQLSSPELLAIIPRFEQSLKRAELFPLRPQKLEIFQVNIGKMCNQTCHHCHVDAGPDRKELMSQEIMQQCIDVVARYRLAKVDITGGAPEMHPLFRWFVVELKRAGAHVMNRCNLTILSAHERFYDLPDFFKQHQVEIISSLPHYTAGFTDRQRGQGVFAKSIDALKRLNQVGYGRDGSGLSLNLVYNPAGAFLPGDQMALERDFKHQLKKDFGIEFNHLYCITNMPISRYLEYLLKSGNFNSYMSTLVNAFNPSAAAGVMCRNTVSIGWDGQMYDCDFNQMLDLPLKTPQPPHVRNFSLDQLARREIVVHQHCYGCTAGSGSSCGGATA